MKKTIIKNLCAMSSLTLIFSATAFGDAQLDQEAEQAVSAAKQSDELAKAGKQEVEAAKEHGQDLAKKTNEAELSKYKTDGDIQKLRVEFQKLVKENEASELKLKIQQSDLERRQGDFETQKANNDEESHAVKKEAQEIKEKLASLEDSNHNAEVQAKAAKSENEKLRDEKADLLKKTEKALHAKMKLDEELQTLSADHDQFVRESNERQTKLIAAENSLEQRQKQADTMHAKVSEDVALTKEKIAELKESVSSKESNLKSAESQLKDEKKDLASGQDDIKGINKEVDRLEKEHAQLEGDSLRLKTEKSKLMTENQQLTFKIHGLEARGKIADKEKTKALEEKETAQTQNETLRHDAEIKEADVKNMEQLRDAGKDELKEISKEHVDLLKRNQQSQSEKISLTAEVNQIKRDYERLQAENKMLQLRAAKDDQEIMAQQNKRANLQRSISSLKSKSGN